MSEMEKQQKVQEEELTQDELMLVSGMVTDFHYNTCSDKSEGQFVTAMEAINENKLSWGYIETVLRAKKKDIRALMERYNEYVAETLEYKQRIDKEYLLMKQVKGVRQAEVSTYARFLSARNQDKYVYQRLAQEGINEESSGMFDYINTSTQPLREQIREERHAILQRVYEQLLPVQIKRSEKVLEDCEMMSEQIIRAGIALAGKNDAKKNELARLKHIKSGYRSQKKKLSERGVEHQELFKRYLDIALGRSDKTTGPNLRKMMESYVRFTKATDHVEQLLVDPLLWNECEYKLINRSYDGVAFKARNKAGGFSLYGYMHMNGALKVFGVNNDELYALTTNGVKEIEKLKVSEYLARGVISYKILPSRVQENETYKSLYNDLADLISHLNKQMRQWVADVKQKEGSIQRDVYGRYSIVVNNPLGSEKVKAKLYVNYDRYITDVNVIHGRIFFNNGEDGKIYELVAKIENQDAIQTSVMDYSILTKGDSCSTVETSVVDRKIRKFMRNQLLEPYEVSEYIQKGILNQKCFGDEYQKIKSYYKL